MIFEIIAIFVIFGLSLVLIKRNFEAALTLLVFLSVLLHKEFFSIYRWDLLPIRLFMLAVFVSMGVQFLKWLKQRKDWSEFLVHLKEPFILFITGYWVVTGVSILFSENFVESVLLYGFFTTIVTLGITLYIRLKNNPERILNLIKTYIYVLFGLAIFGFIQLAVYKTTGFIFGALWNIPGRLPRIGATFWDVNHFGALLASLLPVLGVLMLVEKPLKKKIAYGLMFVPMTGMLLLTNSRSAWILAFVAFLTFLIIQLVRIWGKKGVLTLLAIVALISTMGFIEFQNKESPFRAYVKDYFHYRIDSFDSHILLLQGAWQILEMYPYFGGGYGSFFEQFSKTKIAPTYFGRDPISLTSGLRAPGHSIWGEVGAETGWVGIYAYVMLVGLVISSILYVALKTKDWKVSLISSAMVASLIGWHTAGIFYSYKAEFFWLILFFYFLYAVGMGNREFSDFSFKKVLAHFSENKKLPYIVFSILGFVLIFVGLGKNHLIPWDEAIYAKIAKNMVTTGDYLVMRWDLAKVWYEKPPLYMWLMSVSMNLFGITEFAARLPSAIFGFLGVFVTYAFGKKMFNKTTGYIAGLALLTNTAYLYYSRASMTDVTTAFFVTLALLFYYQTIANRDISWVTWLKIGLAVGFGALVKNVVGFLPFVVVGLTEIYLLVTKQTKFMLKNYLVAGLTALAVFMPWHIEMYRQFGQSFIDNYLIYHVLTRGLTEIEDKGKPFFWYLIVLKVGMRIWFVALLGAFPFAMFQTIKKWFNKTSISLTEHNKYVFLMIYSLSIFLFFSSSTSKLVWYVMPLYPILSIIAAHFIERVIHFVMQKIPQLNSPMFKAFVVYSLTVFALGYLFVNKGLVYVSDLTGAQAELLQLKEDVYGTDTLIYVDKVSMPISRFYLNGAFVEVEYSGLENKIKNTDYTETVLYITKESRQERINGYEPEATVIENYADHVLGIVLSEYDRDLDALEKVQNEIEDILKDFTGINLRLNELRLEETRLQNRIDANFMVLK